MCVQFCRDYFVCLFVFTEKFQSNVVFVRFSENNNTKHYQKLLLCKILYLFISARSAFHSMVKQVKRTENSPIKPGKIKFMFLPREARQSHNHGP